MMTEFTPGPWEVVDGDSYNGYPHDPSEYEYRVIPVSTEPRPNNIIASFWDAEWGYEALGNAALIASAPDLLAACEAINKAEERVVRENLDSVDKLDEYHAAVEMVIAAIAKARGK